MDPGWFDRRIDRVIMRSSVCPWTWVDCVTCCCNHYSHYKYYNYNFNYTTTKTTTTAYNFSNINYTTTTTTTALQLQLQLQLHCISLHHTASCSCGRGDLCNHFKNHNHLSVHQWSSSAIHASQQLTSPIVSFLWNFRHRLARYYWYKL